MRIFVEVGANGFSKGINEFTLSFKVEELVNRGIKNIVVVAPAFLADGLETLEELDIELREDFLEMGGEELTVVKCLNDDDQWIEGLESLVRKRLDPMTA